MNAVFRRAGVLLTESRTRTLLLLISIGVLLVGSFPFETALLSWISANRDTLCERDVRGVITAATQEFNDVQRTTRRIAVELGQHPDVVLMLRGAARNRALLFPVLESFTRAMDMGAELYDRGGELVAWSGISGPTARREILLALDGRMVSYVTSTSVSSQLFVVVPVRDQGHIVGAALVRRTIESLYPLNNRYVSGESFTRRLEERAGLGIRVDFSRAMDSATDSSLVLTPLLGIDSSVVGTLGIERPLQPALGERVILLMSRLRTGCIFAAALVVLVPFLHLVRSLPLMWQRLAGFVVAIWGVRYLLLALDIPSGFLAGGIFDPAVFASRFGGGLAKSLGEMMITAVALSITVALVAGTWWKSRTEWIAGWSRRPPWLRAGGVVLILPLIFLLFRGFAATIRTTVFDSRLPFLDPTILFPPPGIAVALLGLLVVGICVWTVAVMLTDLLVFGMLRSRWRWAGAGALYAVTAAAFGLLQAEPLMPAGFLLALAAGMLVFTWWRDRHVQRRGSAGFSATAVLLLLASGTTLYPVMVDATGERDRRMVETFALEILRPVDTWFKFVVEDGLNLLVGDPAGDVLSAGAPEEVERLAFETWGKSAASREGYTSIFELYDPWGSLQSEFSIGSQTSLIRDAAVIVEPEPSRSIRIKTIGDGVNAIRVYVGWAPVATRESVIVGFGRVIVAAGQQTFFRGENPAFLRGTVHDNLESYYRDIHVAEYRGGALLSAASDIVPLNSVVPQQVMDALEDPTVGAVWYDEELDGVACESYFIRKGQGRGDLVVLRMVERGIATWVVGMVTLLSVEVGLLLLALGIWLLYRYRTGRPYRLSFRDRLLAAFLLASVVPLVLVLVYFQITAGQHMMESTARRLEQETAAVQAALRGYLDRLAVDRESLLPQYEADRIAAGVGVDFHLYVGTMVRSSSRPELFVAGLIDRRLQGSTFTHLVLGGRRFSLESERVGTLRYAVGYRPVLDRGAAVIGAIAVPALFRQDEQDRELAARNAFVLGVYAIVMIGVVLMTAILAHRIASPVQQLTAVTRRIAAGDLAIRNDLPVADGEIGELVRSFDTMSQELGRSRDELVRVERELAWKEMARQVAHEIKNPLTPMKLAVQHLRQTYRDRAPQFGEILETVSATVIEQIDTLSRIASEFSSFARMPGRRLEVCDVGAVLREAIGLFEQEPGVRWRTDIAGDLQRVRADREELRRAFINVFRNAIQAMNGQGELSVDAAMSEGSLRITIRDTGPGIPEEIRPKLFLPNFSTKTDGMGLGLAIVKKTIDDLGGSVRIESGPGAGTAVIFELPSLRAEA